MLRITAARVWKKGGLATSNILTHRLELSFMPTGKPTAVLSAESISPITWDTATGIYTVNTLVTKAVIGRCAGKTTKLDVVEFDVKANPHNFAALTLNAVDGQPLNRSGRLLLTVAGNVENSEMGWNSNQTSVGTHWGHAPTICEGITAKITLNTQAKSAKAYALDSAGMRAGEVPAALYDGKISFNIGSQFKTLWYEVVTK